MSRQREMVYHNNLIELKKELVAAKESERFKMMLIKNIAKILPGYVFFKNRESIYLGCNDNYARLFGMTPNDIIGKTDEVLGWQAGGDTAEVFRKGDQETMAGNAVINREELLILPSGKRIYTLVNKLPIIDDDGVVVGVIGSFSDISDLKQKEQELIQARRKAEVASQAKTEFIANMSHDLRTPLSGLLGLTRLEMEGLSESDPQRELFFDLHQCAQQLHKLCESIMNNASLEVAAETSSQSIHFSLYEMMQTFEELFQPTATCKQLDFRVHCEVGVPETLIGHPVWITRIGVNLISNAMKFTEQGKVTVNFNCSTERKMLSMRISDTGPGIAKSDQNRIFEAFTRLKSSYHSQHDGIGLGLHSVKKMLDMMGGDITIESELGQGSVFICQIPIDWSVEKKGGKDKIIKCPSLLNQCPEAVSMTAPSFNTLSAVVCENQPILSVSASSANEAPEQVTKQRVLIVEDNRIARKVAFKEFDKRGYQVDEACSVEEAKQQASKQVYALILMDIGLPDGSGVEATDYIRRDSESSNHKTPIIALTAHSREHDTQQYLDAKMDQVLHKPLTAEMADRLVHKFLQGKLSELEGMETTDELAIIDLKLAMRHMNTDETSAKEMLVLFMEDLPNETQIMQQAYEKKDWKALRSAAHKLNGGASYCVPRFKRACAMLEDILAQREERSHFIEDCHQAYQHFLNEKENLTKSYKKIN